MVTDGLWAVLRGGVKRVVLVLVDNVTGVIWPPVVVAGMTEPAPQPLPSGKLSMKPVTTVAPGASVKEAVPVLVTATVLVPESILAMIATEL
jgi:hypothetical protein